MNLINDIIKGAEEANLSATIYDTLNTGGGFVALFFNFWYGKKFKIPIIKIAILTVVQIAITLAMMLFLLWMGTGFTYFGAKDICVAFVYSIPIAFVCSKLLKLEYGAVLNMMPITLLIVHAIARIGCLFTGCCYGFACEWGLYSLRLNYLVFPIQILEILLLLFMAVALVIISKKQNYAPNGMLMPIMLIAYSVMRFITEFMRDNYKIWMNLSAISFHCLFMFIVGIVLYFLLKRRCRYVSQ